ncbi:hypothetical protein C8J56DRAFT_982674 [Mycena floridula]|nr:hypothetical protein C8J56DRAFT_982674 [Mycena floridula]
MFSIFLLSPTITLPAWLFFFPSVLTASFFALICLGIDELAIYWIMASVTCSCIVYPLGKADQIFCCRLFMSCFLERLLQADMKVE